MKKRKAQLKESKLFEAIKGEKGVTGKILIFLAYIFFYKMKEALLTLIVLAIIYIILTFSFVWETDKKGNLKLRKIENKALDINEIRK
jgi:hypothetical protein